MIWTCSIFFSSLFWWLLLIMEQVKWKRKKKLLTTFTNLALVSVVFVWDDESEEEICYLYGKRLEEKAMLKYLLDSSKSSWREISLSTTLAGYFICSAQLSDFFQLHFFFFFFFSSYLNYSNNDTQLAWVNRIYCALN